MGVCTGAGFCMAMAMATVGGWLYMEAAAATEALTAAAAELWETFVRA